MPDAQKKRLFVLYYGLEQGGSIPGLDHTIIADLHRSCWLILQRERLIIEYSDFARDMDRQAEERGR